MDIHDEIRKHLANGERVFSHAAGRVGIISHVSDNPLDLFPVTIKSMRGRTRPNGATTFLRGDAVKLVRRSEYRGGPAWVVVNEVEP